MQNLSLQVASLPGFTIKINAEAVLCHSTTNQDSDLDLFMVREVVFLVLKLVSPSSWLPACNLNQMAFEQASSVQERTFRILVAISHCEGANRGCDTCRHCTRFAIVFCRTPPARAQATIESVQSTDCASHAQHPFRVEHSATPPIPMPA